MENKVKKFLLLCFFLMIIGCIFYLMNDTVILNLEGSSSVELSLNEEYYDFGFDALSCKLFSCNDLTNYVIVNSSIDSTKVGVYDVTYDLTYKGKKYRKIRQVKVVDSVKPEIRLKGEKKVSLCPYKEYVEEGYEAFDNYDGEITDKVIKEENANTIFYKVFDSSANYTEAKRTIIKEDNQKPTIKLKGNTVINLNLNEEYNEEGYIAIDNCDGDITKNVTVNNNVDYSKAGMYYIKYLSKDSSGNESSALRTIIVKQKINFDIDENEISNNKISKSNYIKNFEMYIRQKNYNVSIGYVNLKTGYTYTYKPESVYYGASLVKTVGALYAYEKMSLNTEIKNLVKKAITVSDNDAHRNLVNKIGIKNLRAYGRSLGASNFLTRSDKDYFGNTTVADQIAIWKYLYAFVNNNQNGKELKSYFINSYFNYLEFLNSPTIMHKYGLYDIYYHDVGIVYSNSPYIVVILTKEGKNDYEKIVSDLSQKIYKFNQIDG